MSTDSVSRTMMSAASITTTPTRLENLIDLGDLAVGIGVIIQIILPHVHEDVGGFGAASAVAADRIGQQHIRF
jgi:hypothetical protein